MSVSDVNVSWSNGPSCVSSISKGTSSVFNSARKSSASYKGPQRPKCVSAKHSGMRFGSWREPKALKSRCNSAIITEVADSSEMQDPRSPRRTAGRAPQQSAGSARKSETVRDERCDVMRLSQPTASSTWKTTKARAREASTDMNYYSWSKMNVYKDYVGVIYGANGTARKPTHK